MPQTFSHLPRASALRRVRYLRELVKNNARLLRIDPAELEQQATAHIDELVSVIASARREAGQPNPASIHGVRVLEIGCGQRCLTGLTLHSLGANYTGIDVDVTSFRMTPGIAWRMLRRNGPYRLLKATARRLFFDRPVYRAFSAALKKRGARLVSEGIDLRVCSAEQLGEWPEKFDVIYSYDVFEHLRPDILRGTVSAMIQRLNSDGCCIVRVNPFCGITGGHSGEWSSSRLRDTSARRLPPWEHLRNPERGIGDTYLNGLNPRDYLEIFSSMCNVLKHYPDNQLGKPFLTPAIEQEFSAFSPDELCTTGWTYFLGIDRTKSEPVAKQTSPASSSARDEK